MIQIINQLIKKRSVYKVAQQIKELNSKDPYQYLNFSVNDIQQYYMKVDITVPEIIKSSLLFDYDSSTCHITCTSEEKIISKDPKAKVMYCGLFYNVFGSVIDDMKEIYKEYLIRNNYHNPQKQFK